MSTMKFLRSIFPATVLLAACLSASISFAANSSGEAKKTEQSAETAKIAMSADRWTTTGGAGWRRGWTTR